VRLGVIPSAFAWVIASSGTWGLIWLQFSCYSWWLPPPKWLGVAEEHWHELVIVRGHVPMIVRGFVPTPTETQRQPLVDCVCHWATSLVVGPCGARGELGCGIPINRWTTKCWSTQREHSVSASMWTSGEKSCVSFSPLVIWWFIGFLVILDILLWLDQSPLHGGITSLTQLCITFFYILAN